LETHTPPTHSRPAIGSPSTRNFLPGYKWLVIGLTIWLQLSLILVLLAPASASAQTNAPAPPSISAASAITVDVASGRILYSKNMHRRLPMASTTKIMTALTAVWIEGTRLNETYTAVKEDLVGEAAMGLRVGDVVTFEDLLYGLFLNSGNDAAMAIARYAGSKLAGPGDPVTRFVARMNQNARNLGMLDSNYTSPFDLAISGWYALKNPDLVKIFNTKSAVRAGKNLSNINKFLTRYPGANGIKPGFTDNAGYCLVASATRNGQTLIAAIQGDSASGYQTDADRLLDYGFNQLKLPEVQQAVQQGASSANAANYIGRPNGDRLIPLNQPVQAGSATGVNVVNIPANGGIINAQINQTQLTPGSSQVTPDTTGTSLTPTATTTSSSQSDNGGTTDTATTKKEGGINFFGILLFILVALGVLYCILRFTPLGGDRGKDIAYAMEDFAARAWHLLLTGAQKLWHFVRPGTQEDQPFRSRPDTTRLPSQVSNPRPTPPLSDAPRVSRPSGQFDAANPDNRPGPIGNPPTPSRQNPSRPIGYPSDTRADLGGTRPRPSSDTVSGGSSYSSLRSQGSESLRGSNPLENIFDDVDPFGDDKFGGTPGSQNESATPLPPRPLTNRPAPGPTYPNRTAAEPQQKPDDVSSGYRLPPTPRSPLNPTPPVGSDNSGLTARPATNYGFEGSASGTHNTSSRSINPPPSGDSGDSLSMRARQAIDYAYAGRIVASTDEFRRVVEQDPLFDFGSIEEFEQMPVLGYKALATAYRDIGRARSAFLLLDMAIEQYPNNLELRNMQRNLRRETGQDQ
jgi:D-alanyl-D-alanine carboxypeptidase